jgi:hypothetical protein
MSKRVYGWEDNPAIDSYRFRLSDNRAEGLVEIGHAVYITLADGREAVQFLRPDSEGVPMPGNFLAVWRKRPSGCRSRRLKIDIPPIPVWQMNSTPIAI